MTPRKILQMLLVGMVAVGITVAAPAAAGAQENPDYTAPAPVEVTETDPPAAVSQVSGGELPRTGSDITPALLLGGALVLVGGGLVVSRRRLTT